jgi:hypothetical protein
VFAAEICKSSLSFTGTKASLFSGLGIVKAVPRTLAIVLAWERRRQFDLNAALVLLAARGFHKASENHRLKPLTLYQLIAVFQFFPARTKVI